MQIKTVIKKTLEDLSSPKFLLGFLIGFFVLTLVFSLAVTAWAPENFSTLPLKVQEVELAEEFSLLAFIILAGIPPMSFGAIASANYISREEEDGTMRILLSKPVRRWGVLLGKFGGIVLFSFIFCVIGYILWFYTYLPPNGC